MTNILSSSYLNHGKRSSTSEDVHKDGESPWPNISKEFDEMMMKELDDGFNYKSDQVKMVRIGENGKETIVPAADRRFCTIAEMRDMNNRPVVLDKKYFFREADRQDFRALDWENNKRQIVFNPSRNNGLYLKFDKRFNSNASATHGVRYPGNGEGYWLLGMLSGTSDVSLGKNQLSSQWMFEADGTDRFGEPCYAVWTRTAGASESGGIWFPENGISRAGYDGDWEWRSYTPGYRGPPNGYFRVKFQRIDYNE